MGLNLEGVDWTSRTRRSHQCTTASIVHRVQNLKKESSVASDGDVAGGSGAHAAGRASLQVISDQQQTRPVLLLRVGVEDV